MNNDFLKEQYGTSNNLSARIQLHEKFSTNKYRWPLWVFDQINSDKELSILEVGCGNGDLWVQNKFRINNKWNIILSDSSSGMLEEAQNRLKGIKNIEYKVFDVQNIPFPSKYFDVVIANHMLYHVANVDQGISEIARALKDNGTCYASTNSEEHMKEVFDIILQTTGKELKGAISSFSVENGMEILSKQFSKVQMLAYPDALVITEIQPLFEYIMSIQCLFNEKNLEAIRKSLEQKFSENNKIEITKESVLFVSQK